MWASSRGDTINTNKIMALNFGTSFIHPKPSLIPKPKHLLYLKSSLGAAALSEGTEGGNTDQEEFSTYSGIN